MFVRPSKIIVAVAGAILCAAISARAKEWRGIVPLHSTRADVERLLGPPTGDYWHYKFGEETAHITYADAPCEEGLPQGWNVPKDTVLDIYTLPAADLKLADVLVAGKNYRQIHAAHTPHVDYVDAEEGVRYTTINGLVQNISYFANAADNKRLRCGEYKYAAPVAEGVELRSVGHYPLDSFGDIRFEDAKARLDNFAIALQNLRATEPKTRGYIVVYAGRHASAGEAQFRADCAKDYLLRERGIDAESLFAAAAGHRDELSVELYIGYTDVYPPLLTPSVSPRKVEVVKGRLRSCYQRSAAGPNPARDKKSKPSSLRRLSSIPQ